MAKGWSYLRFFVESITIYDRVIKKLETGIHVEIGDFVRFNLVNGCSERGVQYVLNYIHAILMVLQEPNLDPITEKDVRRSGGLQYAGARIIYSYGDEECSLEGVRVLQEDWQLPVCKAVVTMIEAGCCHNYGANRIRINHV